MRRNKSLALERIFSVKQIRARRTIGVKDKRILLHSLEHFKNHKIALRKDLKKKKSRTWDIIPTGGEGV